MMRCLVLLAPLLASTAWAQPPEALPDVVALSPADREAALDYGATHAAPDLPINGLSRGIHGQVGAEIGSRGTRALFGVAEIPLGDTGAATISVLDARTNLRPR